MHHYIEPNALIGLEYTDEKWEVIRSVFQENDNATCNPKGCLLSSDHRIALRGVAFSLMDVASDTDNGKPVLRRNSTYAVSMSPALFHGGCFSPFTMPLRKFRVGLAKV